MPPFRAVVRLAATLGILAAAAVACGGSTTASGADGGNAQGCPAATPNAKISCNTPGLQCSYGCGLTAVCSGGSWQLSGSNISCADDSGSPSDAAATCSTSADCTSGYQCTPGGTIVGCGICAVPQNPCSTDSDCTLVDGAAPGTTLVCAPSSGCTCPVNGKSGSCIPACQSASDCTPDEACAPTGHCAAKPCTSDAQCPGTQTVDYACAGGTCAIKTCTTSADCGTHFCVSGTCSPEAGMCSIPPA
jgi:hypothetical protein